MDRWLFGVADKMEEDKMSLVSRLASQQGRTDDEPNKELARELVDKNDVEGIRGIAENLYKQDPGGSRAVRKPFLILASDSCQPRVLTILTTFV